MRKRIFAITFCFIITACLSGCANREDGSPDAASAVRENTDELVDVAQKFKVEADLGKMNNLQLIGNSLYYNMYGQNKETEEYYLECCRQTGFEEPEVIHTYEDNIRMISSCVDQSGNWYNFYLNGDEQKYEYFLEKLNEHGIPQFCVEVTDSPELSGMEGVSGCGVTGQGEFCILTAQGDILIWDDQGKKLSNLSAQWKDIPHLEKDRGLVNAGEDGIYLYVCEKNIVELRQLKISEKTLGSAVTVEVPADLENGANVFSDTYAWVKLTDGYSDGIFIVGKDALWQYIPSEDKLIESLVWSDEYLNIQPDSIERISRDGEKMMLLTYDRQQQVSGRIEVNKRRRAEIPGKETIVLGCRENELKNLEGLINKYNDRSEEYYIQLMTYGTRGDPAGSLVDEMDIALLKGEGPDLISLTSYSMDAYSSKGVLVELTSYMERDSTVKEEDLLDSVLEALKIDQGLYGIGPEFVILGLVTQPGYAVNGGISISRFKEMVAEHPDSFITQYGSFGGYLNMMMLADAGHYIDWQERSCSFNSEGFIALLEMIKEWKKTPDDVSADLAAIPASERLFRKNYLFENAGISNMWDYLQIKSGFGEAGELCGYPNEEGEQRYLLSLPYLFGIGSASGHKEGAWDFMKYILSEDFKKEERKSMSAAFPVREENFEAYIQEGYEKDVIIRSNRNRYSGEEEPAADPTEKDIAGLKEMVNHVFYYEMDRQISNIIYEETQPVFDGQKEASEAAVIIQNRVSLLLNE